MRQTLHDLRQRYGCNACGHTFINQVTKHSGYPVKLMMEAISHYNLGHAATTTLQHLKRRFAIQVPETTFRFWYSAHKPICTYHQLRSQIKPLYHP
jgi:hypothetical protein